MRCPTWPTGLTRVGAALAFGLCGMVGATGITAVEEHRTTGDFDRSRILGLGPWPPPWRPDPTNRLSGQPGAIEFGRLLFRDARLGPLGYIACVSCHQPDRAFTDWKPRAHGLADLPRNTPALLNLRQHAWYGWGGASDSLWLASIRPILDPREHGGSAASVVRVFERDENMAACYRRLFGASPLARPERTLLNVGKAIAAYLETLASGRTPFDDYRDALERGDAAAAATYPPSARRGLANFVDICLSCHSGPNFSDGRFHGVALSTAGAGAAADRGRQDDVRKLLEHPLNLTGAANDDRSGHSSRATRALRASARMDMANADGQFRTPSLRNVGVTAPYLHDGRADTLPQAIGQHVAQPLSNDTLRDLEAFLHTLTDRDGARRPWPPSQLETNCR